jgi:peptidoglycan/LPS O-acetylase OafA/YrhL
MNNQPSPSFRSFLDLSRALAAIVVFLTHLRDPLFIGYPNLSPDQHGILIQAWYFLTGFGFAAVMVFFVLSGFLVGGVGLSRARDRSFEPTSYFIDRTSRLFVVLIPALIITALLDHAGNIYFPSMGFWDSKSPVLTEKFQVSFIQYSGLKFFICNLVMLQPFWCPVFGSNVPLWSLSYEFWFYVCFGLAAMITTKARRWRLFVLVCLAGTYVALGTSFVWLSLPWLFGVGAHAYRGSGFRWPRLSILLFAVTASTTRIMGFGAPNGDFYNNLCIVAEGAAFAWVLISMRNVKSHWLEKFGSIGSRLASFSFTLYLIHFPAMLFVIALLAKVFHLGDLAQGVPPESVLVAALYCAVFVIVMILAWFIASLTEAHTEDVRAWIKRRLGASRCGRS